ncbi:MAG: SAM-dependent methyltransferase [Candidatus Magnetomorum sp.]|nr:SAM-dependent methyltransferase [Candidatus Magnetomorum sp.]
MKEKKSSYSAEIVATMRAIESLRPENERLFYDPFARYLVSNHLKMVLSHKLLINGLLWFIKTKGPGFPDGIVVRTRYIDDLLQERIESGIEQCVILGAGFDARALRIPSVKSIKVFEIDHPATQEFKQEKLKKIVTRQDMNHITFVPVNFNTETIAARLPEAGFDPGLKTFFIWEGVTFYLTADAVDETLKFVVKNSGADSSVYFDYMFQCVLDGRCQKPESKRIRQSRSFVSNGSEAYTFGIEEGTINHYLTQLGFSTIVEMTGRQLKNRYFSNSNSKRTVHEIFGYVHARKI